MTSLFTSKQTLNVRHLRYAKELVVCQLFHLCARRCRAPACRLRVPIQSHHHRQAYPGTFSIASSRLSPPFVLWAPLKPPGLDEPAPAGGMQPHAQVMIDDRSIVYFL